MRHLKFILLSLALIFAFAFPHLIQAQIKFMPEYISVGNGYAPVNGYLNFINSNGMYWKYLDHHFRIDLRGNTPALCGTNDRIDFADTGYGKPYHYIPFTCASVFSLWTNEFLNGNQNSALKQLSEFQAYSINRGSNDGVAYSLKSTSANLDTTDDDPAIDYRDVIPLLFHAIAELKETIDMQAQEIELIESMIEANKNLNTTTIR